MEDICLAELLVTYLRKSINFCVSFLDQFCTFYVSFYAICVDLDVINDCKAASGYSSWESCFVRINMVMKQV